MVKRGISGRADRIGLRGAMSDRLLPFVVAAMSFLAALALTGNFAAGQLAVHWLGGARKLLIIEVPDPGAPAVEALPGAQKISRIAAAKRLLESSGKVIDARILSDAELAHMVKPWLGSDEGATFPIALPGVIVAHSVSSTPTVSALTKQLSAVAPKTLVESGQRWSGRLVALTNSLRACAFAVLILVALVVNRRLLPETDRSPGEPLDVPGALVLAVAVGSLLLGVNRAGSGWTSPIVLASLGAAALAFPLFALVERRAASPVFPLEWLANRSFTLPCLAAFAINFAYMGGFFLTPLFLEQGLHYSIGAAGFFQIARPLVFAVAAPAAGYLAVRTGERAAAVAGGLVLMASMLAFSVIGVGSSALLIVVALGASGLANGVAAPSVSAMVAGAVDPSRMGSASAAMQVASQIGVVAGIQVMETVQFSRQPFVGVVSSYQDAYLAGAVVTVLAVIAALMIQVPGRRRRAGRWRLARASTLGPEAAIEMG